MDTSGLALRRVQRHAEASGVSLTLNRADLSRWLPAQSPATYDVVVCTEVLYLRENHRALFEGLVRVLKPSGLGFISHRPTGYYLAEAFERRDWEAVRLLMSPTREGTLWGSYYNWQDREDLEGLYRRLSMGVLSITPIGFLSWLAVNPETLDRQAQGLLFQIEIAPHPRCPGSGRYLLVSSRKQPC